MSDIMLRTAVATRVAIDSAVEHARSAIKHEEGQDLVEYAGLLIIVALIVAAIIAIGIPALITNHVKPQVTSILKTGSGSGSGPNG